MCQDKIGKMVNQRGGEGWMKKNVEERERGGGIQNNFVWVNNHSIKQKSLFSARASPPPPSTLYVSKHVNVNKQETNI